MATAEYFRARRDGLAARGLCTRCGRKPPQAGKRECFDCALSSSKRHASRADKLLDAGLCSRCGKRPRKDGLRSCEQCAEREKERSREWRQRHAAE